jgi:2,4-dienoyl-CoA reductase-like NADH-dependent reductase (Old Yellow Enzyme family)
VAPFNFRSADELLEKAALLGIDLPFQEDLSPLFEWVKVGSFPLVNRLTVQPMEGCDALADGSPGELTFRRYRRYARGGSGTIWFEATAVKAEARSNPRQLWLHRQNVAAFRELVEKTRQAAYRIFGVGHDPFLVLQLTHSGRYSRPDGRPKPLAAAANPYLDKDGQDVHILGDGELDQLQERFVEAAYLAWQAGFDAVDIKACHGYLVNELLGGRQRRDSRYGGAFENRCRFLLDVCRKIRAEVYPIMTAVRLSAYDGVPYPYGFGVSQESREGIDLSEVMTLLAELGDRGCQMGNITVGNPQVAPHLTRPYDRGLPGAESLPEHPLEGVYRLIRITGELQNEFCDLPLLGSGYSWLRHFFPQVAAAVVRQGGAALIGLGRSAFAYPEAPRHLLEKGALDPQKVCIACSRCSELMRFGRPSGCVVRDKEIYGKAYQGISKTP